MLQKSSIRRTLEFFFLNPTTDHYLMNISKTINLAHTSVKKNLVKLVKLELIKKSSDKKGKRAFPIYKASRNNNLFKRYKMNYNLASLLGSGIIDFIEEKLMPRSIVLFGSYQRGEDIEDSDIDIFIECEEERLDFVKFEKKLCRKIEPHFNKNFNSYPKELKNNIINGTLVGGFLEVYK